jgi:uncharacterized protein
MEALPQPTQRLPPQAKAYWRATYAGSTLGALVAGLVALSALRDGGVEGVVAFLPLVAAVLYGAFAVTALPGLRWRRWAYEVRDDEIDLRHGALVVRRTLVPIRRVQHVDTETGPLQGSFGLSTVSFHTAAGTTSIPALGTDEAERVRARVAALSRTRDDT